MGKLFDLCKPQFFHLLSGANYGAYFLGLW